MKVQVDTSFNKSIIQQKTCMVDYAGKEMSVIARRTIQLQDEGVQKALTELGWKPPEVTEKLICVKCGREIHPLETHFKKILGPELLTEYYCEHCVLQYASEMRQATNGEPPSD